MSTKVEEMTPEELDKAKWDEACARADKEYVGKSTIRWVTQRSADHYRQMTIDNWQPTPKPSPRVMAMREWLKATSGLRQWGHWVDQGKHDDDTPAQAYLAGFDAAVKEAEPIVARLKDRLRFFPIDTASTEALTTYLAAIGDETL